ncbi:Cytochrome p450 [Penicillium paradoxum]|uniref:Cytochrome p450 n=1 Tax=Penicillium paradoxum TaxID=176176 RepID=UPI00254670EB|nr:Cytochrome p450 [Penicillium paradoxum]KAJ5793865.1 Cytochrome p450 [Penicillium paradoxum]
MLAALLSPETLKACAPYVVTSLLVLTIFVVLPQKLLPKPYPGIPLVGMKEGPHGKKELKDGVMRYLKDTKALFREGKSLGKAYQIMTATGFKIVMPPKYLNEIRDNPNLDFGGFIQHDFFAHLPGFGAFNAGINNTIIQETLKTKLTGSLARITDFMSDEMTVVCRTQLPQVKEWTEIQFHKISLASVAEVSARVFLGEDVCRNPTWLKLSIDYTMDVVLAARALRMWPRFLVPVVHWFLPETRKVRQQVEVARSIIQPEIDARRKVRAAQEAQGLDTSKKIDSLQWMEDTSKERPFNIVFGQLLLTFASIHTTSNLLQNVMYDLIANPEYIDLLRQEIIEVLKDQSDGWQKTSLHSLKMMDSVFKESQRLNIYLL